MSSSILFDLVGFFCLIFYNVLTSLPRSFISLTHAIIIMSSNQFLSALRRDEVKPGPGAIENVGRPGELFSLDLLHSLNDVSVQKSLGLFQRNP